MFLSAALAREGPARSAEEEAKALARSEKEVWGTGVGRSEAGVGSGGLKKLEVEAAGVGRRGEAKYSSRRVWNPSTSCGSDSVRAQTEAIADGGRTRSTPAPPVPLSLRPLATQMAGRRKQRATFTTDSRSTSRSVAPSNELDKDSSRNPANTVTGSISRRHEARRGLEQDRSTPTYLQSSPYPSPSSTSRSKRARWQRLNPSSVLMNPRLLPLGMEEELRCIASAVSTAVSTSKDLRTTCSSLGPLGGTTRELLEMYEGRELMPLEPSRILKLSGMIDNRGGELEKYRMSEEQMKGMKRNVKAFYRAQNDVRMLAPPLRKLTTRLYRFWTVLPRWMRCVLKQA